MLDKLQPKDLIALVLIIGLFLLRGMGIEFMIPAALYMIFGYYFAKRHDGKDTGK